MVLATQENVLCDPSLGRDPELGTTGLDHHHYARWIPIHISTMNSLSQMHPEVYNEFQKFTVQKTNLKFSRIGLDHNHEQLNAKVEGVGGAIGLTENETALQRWLVCGPEVARLLGEFDGLARPI